MKWDLKSKRFLDLMLCNMIWASTGFMAGEWSVFTSMIWPMIALNGAYIIGETWRPSGMLTERGREAGEDQE